MKRSHPPLFSLAFSLCVICLACGSSSIQNPEVEQGQVMYVTQASQKAQKDADTAVRKTTIAKEWQVLKTAAEEEIRNTEIRIAESNLDFKKIATLTRRNRDLQMRLESYQPSQGDWEVFSRAFMNDMKEMRNTMKVHFPESK